MVPGLDTALAELDKEKDFGSSGEQREFFTLESFWLLSRCLTSLSHGPSCLSPLLSSLPQCQWTIPGETQTLFVCPLLNHTVYSFSIICHNYFGLFHISQCAHGSSQCSSFCRWSKCVCPFFVPFWKFPTVADQGCCLLPFGLSASQWKWLLESVFFLAPSAHHSSLCSCLHSLPMATPQEVRIHWHLCFLPTRYYYSFRNKLEWV